MGFDELEPGTEIWLSYRSEPRLIKASPYPKIIKIGVYEGVVGLPGGTQERVWGDRKGNLTSWKGKGYVQLTGVKQVSVNYQLPDGSAVSDATQWISGGESFSKVRTFDLTKVLEWHLK